MFVGFVGLNLVEKRNIWKVCGVRDVHCKKCQLRLGWMYEFAAEDIERYKEAKTILEKALVTETKGIEDFVAIEDIWRFCILALFVSNNYLNKESRIESNIFTWMIEWIIPNLIVFKIIYLKLTDK